MFNFFKPKPKNQIEMEVSGINPETNNEFLFYNFIENTPNYILEPWLKKAKHRFVPHQKRQLGALHDRTAAQRGAETATFAFITPFTL